MKAPGGSLRRSGELKRSGGLRSRSPNRPQEGPLTPADWFWTALREQGYRCAVTDERLELWQLEVHHPLPKGILRTRRLYEHVWDPRNALVVLADVHEAHENGSTRIPRSAIRDVTWEFAAELGEWATYEIERKHPST